MTIVSILNYFGNNSYFQDGLIGGVYFGFYKMVSLTTRGAIDHPWDR